jgi:3-oxoacyl-[acyl-carrier protein] reductase
MESKSDPQLDHVLVTGVCGDIGSHFAEYFLGKGFRVFGLDIASEPPKNCHGHERLKFVSCDLIDPEATSAAIEEFVGEYGPIRIVINNVGIIFNSPVLHFVDGRLVGHDVSDWNRVLSVSLSSAFYVTTACVKHMVARGGGGIVINISSISANGNPGQSAYSAAKGGLNSLTIALAKELGPLGIRVVSIAPGFLDTSSTRRAMSDDALKKIKRSVPLRRFGTVEELAHAVQFVVDNPYYTGTILELDGGLSI